MVDYIRTIKGSNWYSKVKNESQTTAHDFRLKYNSSALIMLILYFSVCIYTAVVLYYACDLCIEGIKSKLILFNFIIYHNYYLQIRHNMKKADGQNDKI